MNKQICPNCGGEGGYESYDPYEQRRGIRDTCYTCHGTGYVDGEYLIKSLIAICKEEKRLTTLACITDAKNRFLAFDGDPVGSLYDFLTEPANIQALDESETLAICELDLGETFKTCIGGGGWINVTRIPGPAENAFSEWHAANPVDDFWTDPTEGWDPEIDSDTFWVEPWPADEDVHVYERPDGTPTYDPGPRENPNTPIKNYPGDCE